MNDDVFFSFLLFHFFGQAVTVDGCPVVDLGLDFTLPGAPHLELRKGGRDVAVTAHNVDQCVHFHFLEQSFSNPVFSSSSLWNHSFFLFLFTFDWYPASLPQVILSK